MTPTKEQSAIVEAFSKTRVLKVNACAGSGKSSTLRLLAEANDKPSLYIAFNKVIADEASTKFPKHVKCQTAHSIAYAKYGKMLAHKLSRPKFGYVNVASTPSEIAKYFFVQDIYVSETFSVPSATISKYAKDTVGRFQNSESINIEKKHLPYSDIKLLVSDHSDLDVGGLEKVVLTLAKKLWQERIDVNSPVMATHDTYLKLWQISNPVLHFDIIYVDEAQDMSPVMLDVLTKQTQSKLCFVGDKYQSIYQFRGAVNAMDEIVAPELPLTKSFRYGSSVAELASLIIESTLTGNENINSKIFSNQDTPPESYTMIFRTNAALLEAASELFEKNITFYCEVNTSDIIKKVESAFALYKEDMKNVKHEDISLYPTWSDLMTAAEEDNELKRIANVINLGKATKLIRALCSSNSNPDNASIVLTTAHKSKGKEWSNVVLGDDYPIDKAIAADNGQEANLFYVACTRAINNLYIPDEVFDLYEYRNEYRELD